MRLILNSGQPARSVPQGSYEIILSPLNRGISLVGFGGKTINVGSPVFGTPVHAVKATATLDPTGTDNSVVLTRDEAGAVSSLSAEITTPEQAEISVDFDGTTVSISAGTKFRMTVAGTLSPGATGTLIYGGSIANYPAWSSDGSIETPETGNWILLARPANAWILFFKTDGTTVGSWTSTETDEDFPNGLTYVANGTETGTPIITALLPTSAQVVAAVNASEIPFTASGAGIGAVAAATAAFSSGSNATVAIKGTEMFDATNKYTAISDVIASSTSGWRKVAHSAL